MTALQGNQTLFIVADLVGFRAIKSWGVVKWERRFPVVRSLKNGGQ